jgi:hypothetical protein
MTSLPGLNSGWDDLKPVARGFGPEAATKAPVKINTTPATPPKAPGRIASFFSGRGGGGLGGGRLGGGGGMFGQVK